MLLEAWPLALSSLAIILYLRIDQIMLGRMLGSEAVGLYSVAVRLAEAWLFLPTALIGSSFPSVARGRSLSPEEYRRRLQALHDALVLITYVVAAMTTLFARPRVVLLFGPSYSEAADVLMVLTWCAVFSSLSAASGNWYVLEGLQKLALARNLLGLLVNVALNAAFVPRFGMIAAAYATLAGQACAALFFDFFTKQTRGLFVMKLEALAMLSLWRRVRLV
jgi:O-antigen/teichoic acid export membrane protein